ncbi:MAG: regulatory protein RecX [Lachnospiraceae bacterium]
MVITAIERSGKRKYLFFIDGEYSFFLTDSELKVYDLYSLIKEILGNEESIDNLEVTLKNEVFDSIHDNTVIDRGKRYALDLLSNRDYNVHSLTEKLVLNGYIPGDAELIIQFLRDCNYVNDVRYAVSYIRSKENKKSARFIENSLLLKGISSADIRTAFDTVNEEHEKDGISGQELARSAINSWIRRKLKPDDLNNQDKITKVIASLLRNGYKYSDIKQCLNDYINENQ